MKHLYAAYLLLLLLVCPAARAQIGMGGSTSPSAVLDLKSPANNKGFLMPRLTSAQRKAIASPAPGLMVFDTDKGTLYLFDGQNWLPLAITTPGMLGINRTASDGTIGDRFGSSVSISGDYAIVGGYRGAYIFARIGNNWIEQQKLSNSDARAGDLFGVSVAVSGDYAIVGCYSTVGIARPAYVFFRNGTVWTQQAMLTGSDSSVDFGTSVAISGDNMLVGDNGKAYIFNRSGTTWSQVSRLIGDGTTGDLFGISVAISGTRAIVGASIKTINGKTNQGAAYIFENFIGGIWSQQAMLTASDGEVNDYFGRSVAISGTYAVVGAYGKGTFGIADVGAAYIYSRNASSWSFQQKLTPQEQSGVRFGSSVSISGNYALVSQPYPPFGTTIAQSNATLYTLTGASWTLVRYIVDPLYNLVESGASVSISNGAFIIGGPANQSNLTTTVGKVSFGTVD